jgi:hypothetical protein
VDLTQAADYAWPAPPWKEELGSRRYNDYKNMPEAR